MCAGLLPGQRRCGRVCSNMRTVEPVFLDEVGETSLAMQAKLLRVIQNREVQRVGSPEVRHVNVRLIGATNRDLRGEVLAGRFREDLFYRLSSIQIRVPSLTERLEDIPLLVQFFVKKYNHAYGKSICGLTRRAQTVLLQHPWPGNVRELENVISSAAIIHLGRLYRPDGFAGKSATPRAANRGRHGMAAAFAGRSSQSAYSAGAGDVHGEPFAGRASVRYRAHQFVSLPETRSARARATSEAARGGRGRIRTGVILRLVDARLGKLGIHLNCCKARCQLFAT